MITTTTAPEIERTVHLLEDHFPAATLDRIAFRLWDGTRWPNEERRAATIVLNHPDALSEMLAAGTEKGLAEAYLRGDFDVEGDLEAACALADRLTETREKNGWRRPCGFSCSVAGSTPPSATGRGVATGRPASGAIRWRGTARR